MAGLLASHGPGAALTQCTCLHICLPRFMTSLSINSPWMVINDPPGPDCPGIAQGFISLRLQPNEAPAIPPLHTHTFQCRPAPPPTQPAGPTLCMP